MNLLLMELPIGSDFEEVLWHLLNFVVLLIGIRFLLYVPIKKFISKRESEMKDKEEFNRITKEEALAEKLKYEGLVDEAQSQVAKIAEEASAITEKNSLVILDQARQEAKAIVAQAHSDAKQEMDKIMPELKGKSSELAIAIAEKILNTKITDKDMDKLIDVCLDNWSNK